MKRDETTCEMNDVDRQLGETFVETTAYWWNTNWNMVNVKCMMWVHGLLDPARLSSGSLVCNRRCWRKGHVWGWLCGKGGFSVQ